MSHFSTIRTKITEGEILKSSLKNLGFVVKENADVRGYNGSTVRADIVAVLEKADYDLGFTRGDDGSYGVVGDVWGIGKGYNFHQLVESITQKYAVEHATNQAKAKGLAGSNVNVRVSVA